jgi:Aldo/keto reductase family
MSRRSCPVDREAGRASPIRRRGRVRGAGRGPRARAAGPGAVPCCAPVPLFPFAWNIRLPRKLWATPVARIDHESRMFRGNFRIAEPAGHPPPRPVAHGASGTPGTRAQPRERPGTARPDARPAPSSPVIPDTPGDQWLPAATPAIRHKVPLTGRRAPAPGPASCEPARPLLFSFCSCRAAPPMRQQIDRHRSQLEVYEELCTQLGEPPADVALAWLLHHPAVTAAITGPRNPGAAHGQPADVGDRHL